MKNKNKQTKTRTRKQNNTTLPANYSQKYFPDSNPFPHPRVYFCLFFQNPGIRNKNNVEMGPILMSGSWEEWGKVVLGAERDNREEVLPTPPTALEASQIKSSLISSSLIKCRFC